MSSLKHMLEVSATSKEAYAAGYAAGKQAALLEVQSALSHVALDSLVNRNESKYENLVIMLSDIDKVINKMLWVDTLKTFEVK